MRTPVENLKWNGITAPHALQRNFVGLLEDKGYDRGTVRNLVASGLFGEFFAYTLLGTAMKEQYLGRFLNCALEEALTAGMGRDPETERYVGSAEQNARIDRCFRDTPHGKRSGIEERRLDAGYGAASTLELRYLAINNYPFLRTPVTIIGGGPSGLMVHKGLTEIGGTKAV